MTIKQQGGIFGRNPTFNNVGIDGDLNVGSVNLANTTGTGNVLLSNEPTLGYKQKIYSGDGRSYSYNVLKLLSDIPGATATDIFTFTKGAGGVSSDVYSIIGGTITISAGVQLTGGYNFNKIFILPFGICARGANNAEIASGTQEIVNVQDNTGYSTTVALTLSATSNTSATLALTLTNNRGINVSDLGIQLNATASASANALLFDVDRA